MGKSYSRFQNRDNVSNHSINNLFPYLQVHFQILSKKMTHGYRHIVRSRMSPFSMVYFNNILSGERCRESRSKLEQRKIKKN